MDEKGGLEQQLQAAQAASAELEQSVAEAQTQAQTAHDRCQLLEAQVYCSADTRLRRAQLAYL